MLGRELSCAQEIAVAEEGDELLPGADDATPAMGIPVTSTALGTLERDPKKEAKMCVPSEVVLR